MKTTHRYINTPRLIALLAFLFVVLFSQAQTVQTYLTTGNLNSLLQQYPTKEMTSTSPTLKLDPDVVYQEIDGFGFTYTQGSAYNIDKLMNSTQQDELLEKFFDPVNGIGVSIVRIGIGATDLSESGYTYDDNGPDPNLNNFSLAGPDLDDLIPQLKKVKQLNPDVRFLATPWSAPAWMKNNNGLLGGELKWENHAVYAQYFVKYIQAMEAQGLPIWAITPQNEPGNEWNYPSMKMTREQQLDFINNHLGPAFENAGITTKIICYDHNLDDLVFPVSVAKNSQYVYGSAFHLYDGQISSMTDVYNATNKKVFFTEQWVHGNANPYWDFKWHQENVFMGSLRNYSSSALQWNFASDEWFHPHTGQGSSCEDCEGAVIIKQDGSYDLRVGYANLANYSKFVKPGAYRVAVIGSVNNVTTVGFVNPDGSRAVVAYNPPGGSAQVKVGEGSMSVTQNMPENSLMTFYWGGEPIDPDNGGNNGGNNGGGGTDPVTEITPGEYYIVNRTSGKYLEVSGSANGDALTQYGFSSSNAQKFVLTQESNGSYAIKSKSSGKVLDVADVSMEDGGVIHQWDDFGSDNQRFNIVETSESGYFNIIAVHSNKALDLKDGNTNDGATIQQWTISESHNAQWQFVSTLTVNAVEDNHKQFKFAGYPNPVRQGGTLYFADMDAQAIDVQVMDVSGKIVMNLTGLDVPYFTMDFEPGLYIARYKSNAATQWSVPTRLVVVE